ncbi:amidohydrolase family protein [Geoalkalibacter halelectricus]|uniref:Amidohydrolase family protein n=1 Tax=Geoalkalibacter halelectricus TaxID=2847045 RepID=A0ABY5ZMQ9_9BACT|nr:amidohydrolase family protein [Geoalkalibacter halelectricus]MDO3379653.1 amidohydrolase family protein [Geoalkalibacter halelectricus]UWZ78531.1 amidohydrolase family protein [Geoalkalibacter halelectricus]
MSTLYRARYLVPVTRGVMEDGALLVAGGQIVDLGSFQELTAAHPRAAVVDFGDDSLLLPPLANAHTHLELTHFPDWLRRSRESGDPENFVDWILRVIRVKRAVAQERLGESLRAGIRACLAAGTGAVGDILSWLPGREVYRNAPLYGRLYLETLGLDPGRNRQMLRLLGHISEECLAGRLRLGLAPHSPYNLSSEYLEDIFRYARRHRLPLTTHVAESDAEVQFLREGRGPIAERLYPYVGWTDMLPAPAEVGPIAYLQQRDGLVADNLLVHGVHVDAADCRAIAGAAASVVLCPRSNQRLGVGVAPVADYVAAGVNLALGTDSLASNESLSVWDELAFARQAYGSALSPETLLRMATCNGAKALGLGAEMGCLEPRYGAHFQVLRMATIPPRGELMDYLVSPGRTQEVRALFLAGRDAHFSLDSGQEVC